MLWRTLVGSTAVALTISTAGAVVSSAVPAESATAGSAQSGAAPGGPGGKATWTEADKTGFGTARTRRSNVWFTLQRGRTSEVFYPDLATPGVRSLELVVTGGGFTDRESSDMRHRTVRPDPRSLTFREINTDKQGRYRIVETFVTDPRRAALDVRIRFRSLDGGRYRLYALYDPSLANTGMDDSGRTVGHALVASDAAGRVNSALVGRPAFDQMSTGYLGTSDGWSDLKSDQTLDQRYDHAGPGNIVQVGRFHAVTGRGRHQSARLSLGFGTTVAHARTAAHAAVSTAFRTTAGRYARGWHRWLGSLKHVPASAARIRREYDASALVVAAAEDKLHPGAFVASPTAPWVWGDEVPGLSSPSGAYHLVWARDGPTTYAHVKKAADFLADFVDPDTGRHSPFTPQERWENQSGYSPNSIAAEINGLVCAADMARRNGDGASARRWLRIADRWKAHVEKWTVTTNGPLSKHPYFLRLTKNGKPNTGKRYAIGDGGPKAIDQRRVVDPSFLDLVRYGILRPRDRDVRSTLPVIDRKLEVHTPNGPFWHRSSFDGYGETRTGKEWTITDSGTFGTLGRAWPILTDERGEYAVTAGLRAGRYLRAMARASGPGDLLAEQVWDGRPPTGRRCCRLGEGTRSATPLIWTHAALIRLAWTIQRGRPVDQQRVVVHRYLG